MKVDMKRVAAELVAVAREMAAGKKEYAIWGIPQGSTSETLLLAMPQGRPIEDKAEAKRLERLLVEKYGASRTRIQEIDMEGELDWKKMTGLTGADRTAAVKDLADIRKLIPEMRKKQAEYDEMKRKNEQDMNQFWYEATKDMSAGVEDLLVQIKTELVKFFEGEGVGVRRADSSGGLVEVFLGSKDGVKRYQSKVTAMLHLTFEGRENAVFSMRNENVDQTAEGILSDKGTVQRLMANVQRAWKDGFWSEGEQA